MVYTVRFFSSKCSLFHNFNVFGSCIIHILYTGVLKLKEIISAPKNVNIIIRTLEIIATCFGPHLGCLPARNLRKINSTHIQHAIVIYFMCNICLEMKMT